MFCNIKIKFNNKQVKAKALIDTGNLLKDPISSNPVIVIQKNILEEILPRYILENTESIISGRSDELKIEEIYLSRFRIIPFSSLGKQNGMLLGFRPDEVIIQNEEQEEILKEVIIGVYDKQLSKNNLYSALVGLEILEGREKNEYITNIKI